MQKKLEGLNGPEFDKAYMSCMVKDHRKDLAEFKREASNGKDPQVKEAAQQGSQVISEHLQMAESILQKVGADTSGSSSGNSVGHKHSAGSGEGSTTSNPR